MTNLKINKQTEFDFGTYGNSAYIDITLGEGEKKHSLKFGIDRSESGIDQVVIRKPNSISEIESALGTELDFTELRTEYLEQLEKVDELRAEQARQEQIEKYNNWWALDESLPQNHPAEFTIPTLEEYLDQHGSFINRAAVIKYKGHKVSVSYENVSNDRFNKKMKYVIDDSITNYKRRNYASLKNAADKVVKLVDKKEEKEQQAKEREKERRQEVADTLQLLKTEFGSVEHEHRYKSSRYGRGYYMDEYFIKRGGKQFKISAYDVQKESTTKYRFAGFTELTAEQVRNILQVVYPLEIN